MSSTDSDTDPLARWSTTITLGAGKDHAVWSERQVFTWPEMAPRLTQHLPGLKDGLCYTPATFSGTRRQKLDAECIGVAALDVESGTNLEDAAKAIRKRGLAAAIATTFRHMMNESEVSAADFARFEEKTGTVEAPSRYLIERKGMLPAIAIGAVVMDQGEKTITIGHNPCPRFRVVMPLARPWLASAYPDQFKALDTWRGAVAALAHALGVQADPSGFDAAHLFYWPRYAPGGVPPQSLLITGKPVDIFSLPPAPKTTRTYAPRRGASEVAPDLPENITEARRWLAKEAPIATEGRQGDKRTYNVACELHDRGISEPLALEMLDEPGGWNSRCDPPWTLDDLEVKVRNAYRYCDNDFGSKTARSQGQAAFGHIHLEQPEPEAEPPPTRIDGNFWLRRTLTAPIALLGDFITSSTRGFCGGPTGSGKTMLWMSVSVAMSCGQGFLHWAPPPRPLVILYVDGEMPRDLLQSRIRDIHRRMGQPDLGNFHCLCKEDFEAMPPLNTPEGQRFLMDWIERVRPDFLVLDSRMCLLAGDLKDEEVWSATMPFVLWLTRKRLATLWLDHMGHVLGKIYGSKVKEWTADLVMLLEDLEAERIRLGAGVCVRLTFSKARRRDPAKNGADFASGVIALVGDTWTWTPDVNKPAGKVPDWCRPYYAALLTVLGTGNNITVPTWRDECERKNYIEPAEDGETASQRSKRFSKFRAVKSELARLGVISVVDDNFVFCAKTAQ